MPQLPSISQANMPTADLCLPKMQFLSVAVPVPGLRRGDA